LFSDAANQLIITAENCRHRDLRSVAQSVVRKSPKHLFDYATAWKQLWVKVTSRKLQSGSTKLDQELYSWR